jgi:CRISPR-associated protein Csm3
VAKLKEFRIYEGKMVCLSGLHIGAGKDAIEIGGVDATIIKHPITQMPYVPGSSLKGRMRSLLEKKDGKVNNSGEPCGCGTKNCRICTVFGAHKNMASQAGPTRMIVRDAKLSQDTEKEYKKQIDDASKAFLEAKSENIIDRNIGTAKHPRTLERVPEGAEFDVEFVIQVYEGDDVNLLDQTLQEGLALVAQTFLGGSGSRGYGKVEFKMDPVKVVQA